MNTILRAPTPCNSQSRIPPIYHPSCLLDDFKMLGSAHTQVVKHPHSIGNAAESKHTRSSVSGDKVLRAVALECFP